MVQRDMGSLERKDAHPVRTGGDSDPDPLGCVVVMSPMWPQHFGRVTRHSENALQRTARTRPLYELPTIRTEQDHIPVTRLFRCNPPQRLMRALLRFGKAHKCPILDAFGTPAA